MPHVNNVEQKFYKNTDKFLLVYFAHKHFLRCKQRKYCARSK